MTDTNTYKLPAGLLPNLGSTVRIKGGVEGIVMDYSPAHNVLKLANLSWFDVVHEDIELLDVVTPLNQAWDELGGGDTLRHIDKSLDNVTDYIVIWLTPDYVVGDPDYYGNSDARFKKPVVFERENCAGVYQVESLMAYDRV